jgi:hypothetical protein
MAINQLLMEIESSKTNSNKSYSSHDTDSTQSSLKRLLDLSNTPKGASKPPVKRNKTKRVRSRKTRADNKPD